MALEAKRNKLFQCTAMQLAILLLTTILTDTLTSAEVIVTVEPDSKTSFLNVGEQAKILCHADSSISYCRIQFPKGDIMVLSPTTSSPAGFTYLGNGLEAGDCGITIEHVKNEHNGKVICTMAIGSNEVQASADLVIAKRPQQPSLELLSRPNGNNYFVEDQIFEAKCVVSDGRPAGSITWLLNEQPADKEVRELQKTQSNNANESDVFTVEQTIRWRLSAEDNGRKITCLSHHVTDRETLPAQEASHLLHVLYKPVQQMNLNVYGLYLDHTASINITIRANPPPVVEWNIDGITVIQGSENGRFAAYAPVPLGQDLYNVTLTIAGLTLEDTIKTYMLRASNQMGSTDYLVLISSSSKPTNALDIGAIVGIVVAIAVLILIVLLVAFAKATNRWCFGGATLNTDIGPDSEAQINPDQHDDLEGQEFPNEGDEHIDTTEQSEEMTPPVKDKLEAQKKAYIKSSKDRAVDVPKNGIQNGTDPKTNTAV